MESIVLALGLASITLVVVASHLSLALYLRRQFPIVRESLNKEYERLRRKVEREDEGQDEDDIQTEFNDYTGRPVPELEEGRSYVR